MARPSQVDKALNASNSDQTYNHQMSGQTVLHVVVHLHAVYY